MGLACSLRCPFTGFTGDSFIVGAVGKMNFGLQRTFTLLYCKWPLGNSNNAVISRYKLCTDVVYSGQYNLLESNSFVMDLHAMWCIYPSYPDLLFLHKPNYFLMVGTFLALYLPWNNFFPFTWFTVFCSLTALCLLASVHCFSHLSVQSQGKSIALIHLGLSSYLSLLSSQVALYSDIRLILCRSNCSNVLPSNAPPSASLTFHFFMPAT